MKVPRILSWGSGQEKGQGETLGWLSSLSVQLLIFAQIMILGGGTESYIRRCAQQGQGPNQTSSLTWSACPSPSALTPPCELSVFISKINI